MTVRQAAAVFGCCALPRLVWLIFAPDPFLSDYVVLADAWRGTAIEGSRDTWVRGLEPLFPLFLAAFESTLARQVAQVLFVSAGGVCLFELTRRLTSNGRAATAATLLYAVFPYLVWQSAAFNGAPFAAALLAVALLALDRVRASRQALIAGLCFGLLVLTRMSFAPLVGCGAGVLAWRRGWREAALFAGAALLTVAPAILATYARDGGLLPPRSGLNLYLSTCEYGDLIPRHDLDVLIAPTYARLQPLAGELAAPRAARRIDLALRDEALACARERPLAVTLRKLKHAALTFAPLLMPVHPRGPETEAVEADGRLVLRGVADRDPAVAWAHAVSTFVLLAAAVVGMLSGRVGRPAPLFLVLLTLALTNGLFMVSTRLASPTYVVLMIFAGAACARR